MKLGGENQRFNTPTIPLIDRIIRALRLMLDDKTLVVNRSKGASGWVKGDTTWLVCGTVAQQIIDKIYSEGGTDIPNDKNRIFDILQDHDYALPNEKGGAIWRVEVSGDGASHTLTVLRMETRKLFPSGKLPSDFSGSIRILSDDSVLSESTPETAPIEDNSDNGRDYNNDESLKEIHASTDDLQQPCEELSDECAPVYVEEPKTSKKENKTGKPPRGGIDSSEIGMHFFEWVKSCVLNKKILINKPNAWVQVVKEGVLLVSPIYFLRIYLRT